MALFKFKHVQTNVQTNVPQLAGGWPEDKEEQAPRRHNGIYQIEPERKVLDTYYTESIRMIISGFWNILKYCR